MRISIILWLEEYGGGGNSHYGQGIISSNLNQCEVKTPIYIIPYTNPIGHQHEICWKTLF